MATTYSWADLKLESTWPMHAALMDWNSGAPKVVVYTFMICGRGKQAAAKTVTNCERHTDLTDWNSGAPKVVYTYTGRIHEHT